MSYPTDIRNMSKGLPIPGFKLAKVQTEVFSKRTHNISKILFNLKISTSPQEVGKHDEIFLNNLKKKVSV